MIEGKLQFLGTGSSLGVPIICCKCPVCMSHDPKNHRLRSSVLVEIRNKKFVIDAGPDYRTQALRYKIDYLEGFVLTHAHYDHMGGFEDLKVYAYNHRKLPCLLLPKTFQEVREKHHHLFRATEQDPTESPFFAWEFCKKSFGHQVFEGIPLDILTFSQVGMPVMGVRIGNLAYVSDIKEYSEELTRRLEGIHTLIISAPRKTTSLLHFSIEEALAFAKQVQAKTTYLTHIAHEVEHETLSKELPETCFVAYDGLTIPFIL